MTVVEFHEILDSSVHNADATEIMLGKYDGGAPDNYINKAREGGYSYFDLGLEWDRIAKTFGLDDKDMFQLFNVPFLDDAMKAGKPIHFAHDPEAEINSQGALRDEYDRIMGKKTYLYDPATATASPI